MRCTNSKSEYIVGKNESQKYVYEASDKWNDAATIIPHILIISRMYDSKSSDENFRISYQIPCEC